MKYSILINQRTIAERFPTLDLVDAAILAFLADCFASPRIHRRTLEGETWWWVKRTWLASEMPLLGITTRQGIEKRIARLRDAGLLETTVMDGHFSMLRPGHRWDELSGISVAENLPDDPENEGGGDNCRCRGVTTAVAGGDNCRCTPLYKGLDHEYPAMKDHASSGKPAGTSGEISKKSGKAPKPSKAKSRDHESAHHYPEAWQQDVAFTNALADYFRQRREKRQPATPTAAELLRKKLLAAGIETATIALQTSATNGWTGVFPEKTTHAPKEKPGADEPGLALW